MTGYTDKQAYKLVHRLDRAVARAEDAIASMTTMVEDTAESPHAAQEHVREVADRLAETIARRLRHRVVPTVERGGLTILIAELDYRVEGV